MKKVKIMDIRPAIKRREKNNFSFSLVAFILAGSVLLMPFSANALSLPILEMENRGDEIREFDPIIETEDNEERMILEEEEEVIEDDFIVDVISASIVPREIERVPRISTTADEYSVLIEKELSENVLNNDSSSRELKITYFGLEELKYGILKEFNDDGSFVYYAKEVVGQDYFYYIADDGQTKSQKTKVTINVKAPEEVPEDPEENDLISNDDKYLVYVDGDKLAKNVLKNDELSGEWRAIYAGSEILIDEIDSERVRSIEEISQFPLKLNHGVLHEFNPDGSFIYVAHSEGIDTFQYKIQNEKGFSNLAKVSITSKYQEVDPPPANNPPIVDAGENQTVDEGDSVQLNATVTDIDDDDLTYEWLVPAGISLSDTSILNPSFIAPQVTADTTYVLSLKVNDGEVTVEDTVSVTVNNVAVSGGGGYIPPVNNETDLDNDEENTDEELLEEGSLDDDEFEAQVLGEKIYEEYADGTLVRCLDDMRIYVIENGVKRYISSLDELARDHFGKDILNISREEMNSIPEVQGDKIEECVADRKFKDEELIRGSNMRIYVIRDGHKVYISSLEELTRDHFGKEIFNVCDSVLELY